MGREYERKYKAEPEVLSTVQGKFCGFTPIVMETAYYDTPGFALEARKWMLRLRRENGEAVCTLKTPLPDGSRGEWDVRTDDLTAAVPELCKLSGLEELLELTKEGLVNVCAARFTRLAATLVLEEATVELALDEGCFLGGGREVPFSELEVELKAGSEEAAAAFGEDLAREYGLKPEKKSKVQRAMELIQP